MYEIPAIAENPQWNTDELARFIITSHRHITVLNEERIKQLGTHAQIRARIRNLLLHEYAHHITGSKYHTARHAFIESALRQGTVHCAD